MRGVRRVRRHLPDRRARGRSTSSAGHADRWTRTTCPYCGVGCELHVGARDGRIVAVVPAARRPVNRGHLCVKGRYAHGFVHAADRQSRAR